MSKKFTVMLFVTVCMMFLIVGAKFVREIGLLHKYPAAEYFTPEEEEMRPAYSQLSDKEKAVYHALWAGIREKSDTIQLPYEIDGDTYTKLYCLVEKQESDFFYADSTYYTARKLREARIAYREDKDVLDEKITKFNSVKSAVVSRAQGAADDYNKAMRIHDSIVNRCKYVTGEDELYTSTAYGCLVEGKANCEGYAKAFNLIARECGLRCVLVTGKTDTGENHAWNQVLIGDEWYNLDVTWDDSDVAGDTRMEYFLCNDESFGRTHTADNSYFESFKCGGASNAYYKKNDILADSVEKAVEIVKRSVAQNASVIEIKFTNIDVYKEFKADYIDNSEIFGILLDVEGEHNATMSMSVRENEKELSITLLLYK